MKVSIITVCYNSINTIKDTIESVIEQDYTPIEYIIIDGGSNDGTVPLVKKYDKYVNHFISENDLGMYDAINKGIKISTGDLIGVLHSDDIFASSKIISEITNKLISSAVDSIYGDLDYVDINNRNIIRHWESGSYHKRKFLLGWMPPHPTFFVKKNIS